jgi:head-tail adaptor
MAPLQRLNDAFRYTNRSAMRDQITLMQPAGTNAPDGSPNPQTVFANNVWASCKPQRTPMEKDSSELVQGEVYWDVRTPFLPGVSDQMNIIGPNGQQWFIVSVTDPDQRGVELRFLCREMNGGGVVSEVDEFVVGDGF